MRRDGKTGENMIERLKQQPVIGALLGVAERYLRLTAWAVLSAVCVALLVYEGRDVGLTVGNWLALIVATVIVSGLCIWIVSWDDEEEAENAAQQSPEAKSAGN